MSVNNLRNYNWEQGTQVSPVLLTGAEFSKITALIEESIKIGSNIHADIRGWVQVGQHITSYQLYLAQLAKDSQGNPLLHVVNPQVDPTQYTVAPQSSTINEGTNVKLNINGISLDALKFRITNHTNETPDYQARTTIDTQLGYIRVAPAQENTTWTDVVTIQCCPVWEEWDAQGASIVEFTVNVNAVAVTSATITAPSNVKPDITFYPIVNFLPVGHTKNIVNTLEDAGAKLGICFVPTSDDFIVGKTSDPTKMSAIAPNIETPVGQTWSLGCGIYAYSSSQTIATPSANVNVKYPYIQFNVEVVGTLEDVTDEKPSITLEKVDNNGQPVLDGQGNPIVIVLDYDTYAVVSGSTIIYTYGGGNILGDGTEKFNVYSDNIAGYNKYFTSYIIPEGVVTEVNCQYKVITPGWYLIYSDGRAQSYDDFVAASYTPLSGTFVAVKYESLEVQFYIKAAPGSSYLQKPYALVKENIGGITVCSNNTLPGTYATKLDNNILRNKYPNDDIATNYCNNITLTINNKVYRGYLPDVDIMNLMNNNIVTINDIMTHLIYSTLYDKTNGVVRIDSAQANNDECHGTTWAGSYWNTHKTDKTSPANFIPIFLD